VIGVAGDRQVSGSQLHLAVSLAGLALRPGVKTPGRERVRPGRTGPETMPPPGGTSDHDQTVTADGCSKWRGSSVSRAITSRWICAVPSYSWRILASRISFSTG